MPAPPMGVCSPIFCARWQAKPAETDDPERTKGGSLSATERQIEAMLGPTIRALGCEVWGVEFRPRGGSALLRIFIDGVDGRDVTLDDCERVSGQVSALLDVEDPIATKYRLEISSPGLDRVLFRREHYERSQGEQVDVRLAFPFEGRRRFVGLLAGVEGEDVVVRFGEEEFLLPLSQIRRTRIVPDFASEAPDSGAADVDHDHSAVASAGR